MSVQTQIDYLIIGGGLAGIALAEQCQNRGLSFHLLTNGRAGASVVASGLYNPVVLKRLKMSWHGHQAMQYSIPFYRQLQNRIGGKWVFDFPIYRRFASIEEQNQWTFASDQVELGKYLSPEIIKKQNPNLDAPFGFGKVEGTGRLDTRTMLSLYQDNLKKRHQLIEEDFDHAELRVEQDQVIYKEQAYQNVVFAEGTGLLQNPFFNYLPLQKTKGELILISSKELKETRAIKSSVFLLPIKEDGYLVGATYNWRDTSNRPTTGALGELKKKLETFIKAPYSVANQRFGFRPTVPDRRPLLGRHPEKTNLYVMNGLGSRGVLLAPYLANRLIDLIENENPLMPEIDITRFKKRYPGHLPI